MAGPEPYQGSEPLRTEAHQENQPPEQPPDIHGRISGSKPPTLHSSFGSGSTQYGKGLNSLLHGLRTVSPLKSST